MRKSKAIFSVKKSLLLLVQKQNALKNLLSLKSNSKKKKQLPLFVNKLLLSVLIASKVIEKELTAADQEKLINEYIQEAGEER